MARRPQAGGNRAEPRNRELSAADGRRSLVGGQYPSARREGDRGAAVRRARGANHVFPTIAVADSGRGGTTTLGSRALRACDRDLGRGIGGAAESDARGAARGRLAGRAGYARSGRRAGATRAVPVRA